MLPRLAGTDVPDIRRLRIEECCDGAVCVSMPVSEYPDLEHVYLGQFSKVNRFALGVWLPLLRIPRMRLIFFRSDIFQVVQRIIGRITVLVVDLITGRTWADKCFRDQLVDKYQPAWRQSKHFDAQISFLMPHWTQLLPLYASNIPKMADFIVRCVGGWSPDFIHVVTVYNMASR